MIANSLQRETGAGDDPFEQFDDQIFDDWINHVLISSC